jgi:non-heme chloroperoxidase
MKRKTRKRSALLAALLITGCLLCAQSPTNASSVHDMDTSPDSVELVPVDNALGGEWIFDTFALERELDEYGAPGAPKEKKLQIDHLLKTSLPRFEKDLELYQKQLEEMPENAPGPPNNPQVKINAAIVKRFQIYKGVHCPQLAIFANPHTLPPNRPTDPEKRAALIAEDLATTSAEADAIQTGNPSVRVVQLPNASHWAVGSNEADVLGEINAFIATLR